MQTKCCTKCKEIKPITEFYKRNDCRFDVRPECIKCSSILYAEYYKKTQEARKEYGKKYSKIWHEKNKEKANKISAKYYRDNNERERKNGREYRKKHPEKCRENNRRRRALRANCITEIVNELQVYEIHNWVCGICGKRINKKLTKPNLKSKSLDHIIPLSKGGTHTYNNLQPAHLSCNMSKNNKIDNIQLKLS
jgi:hypothetical protein